MPDRLPPPALLLLTALLVTLLDASATPPPDISFLESAAAAGLDFVHFNGMSGALYLAEITGAGVALFDYDGDGDLDVFLVQGTMLGDKGIEAATIAPYHAPPLTHRLFRNDSYLGPDGRLVIHFTDVTERANLPPAGYGMGVTAGDFDNDGHIDLYVTQLGSNQLLRNNGDGTFADVLHAAEVDDFRWSVAAVFFDFNRNGLLDLYIGNYVDFRPASHHDCSSPSGIPDYCGPLSYNPEPDRLFRNRGDGTFEDVTAEAGLDKAYGATLGAVAADFNGNGWLDLYVANDGMPNQLWLNQGDGTFVEEAFLAGVAVNRDGIPEASMGVVAGDLDGTGGVDLFMTHLRGETNTLYLNDGSAMFEDRSLESGLGQPSLPFTGFGVGLADFGGDGWLDLFIANGAVSIVDEQLMGGDPLPLRQPNQMFRGMGSGRFEDFSESLGEPMALSEVSRGVAVGDVSSNGAPDLVVTNNSGPARLYINQAELGTRWLGLDLVTGEGQRPALGARVTLERHAKPPINRDVGSDGSYLSSKDPRVLFAGVTADGVHQVRVTWPSGRMSVYSGLAMARYHRLYEPTTQSPPTTGPVATEERR